MSRFPNSEVPLSVADLIEIERIFIELMRERVRATHGTPDCATPQLFEPPNSVHDFRSQWGML